MKCKSDKCNNELTGRQRGFCSDKCRKRTSRTKSGPQDAPQSTNADKMVLIHPLSRTESEVGQRTRLVPIPGDPDYSGCCKLVDGEWQVDNTKPDVKAMPTDELVRRLHYIKDWQRSPEHKEVQRRRQATGACL